MFTDVAYDEYKGFRRANFKFEGRDSIALIPENPTAERRWIWRAEFFGAFDTADIEMARRGWYVVWHGVSDMYGCPESVELMERFRRAVCGSEEDGGLGLYRRTVLFGFSRGGLYSVNYAAAYPDNVSALYLDAPVLDIRSWPGGKYSGIGAPKCWEECMRWYHLDEESAKTFDRNPLDRAGDIARAKIPTLIIAGGADKDVPAEENACRFVPAMREAGGFCELWIKPDCAHHPHSLVSGAPIADFVERWALADKK
ncbi:MAG: prolyl oligopeptidase family serine peptidase [Eubacteriales bacterium]